MILRNATGFPIAIFKPEPLKEIITVLSNCEITKSETALFNVSLRILNEKISQENIDLSQFHAFNIFFTENGEINIYEDKRTNRGSQFSIAIYRMNPIRELNSDVASMFIFLEEMVHYFWKSSDEAFVKSKVVEIMQLVSPKFDLNYMTERWRLNGI